MIPLEAMALASSDGGAKAPLPIILKFGQEVLTSS